MEHSVRSIIVVVVSGDWQGINVCLFVSSRPRKQLRMFYLHLLGVQNG